MPGLNLLGDCTTWIPFVGGPQTVTVDYDASLHCTSSPDCTGTVVTASGTVTLTRLDPPLPYTESGDIPEGYFVIYQNGCCKTPTEDFPSGFQVIGAASESLDFTACGGGAGGRVDVSFKYETNPATEQVEALVLVNFEGPAFTVSPEDYVAIGATESFSFDDDPCPGDYINIDMSVA